MLIMDDDDDDDDDDHDHDHDHDVNDFCWYQSFKSLPWLIFIEITRVPFIYTFSTPNKFLPKATLVSGTYCEKYR